MSRLIYIVLVLAAALAVAQSAPVWAAITQQMNYQGKLTNASDITVANGSYNFRFRLCAASDCTGGGDPLWVETRCFSPDSGATCDGTGSDQRLVVASGQFNAMLGSITSLAAINFNQALYLEVQVGGSATTPSWETLTPRKLLGAVPGAFEASKLGGKAETALATLADDETVTGAYSFTKAGTALSVTNTASIGTLNLTNALGTAYGGTGATSLTNLITLTTHTTGNYVASATASGGLNMTGTEGGSLGILLPAATDALSATTSSGSGLELLASGLTLLQGCADTQLLKWNEGTDSWTCSADATGAGLFTDDTGFTYLTDTAEDLVLGSNAQATAEFWFDIDVATIKSVGNLTIDTQGNLIVSDLLDLNNQLDLDVTTAGGYAFDANNVSATGYAGRFQIAGSTILTIGDPVMTASIPLSVTAAGDTGIAYDLILTNIESANIKSQGPLYITAGDPNHNENLILTASGSGKVVLNDEAHIATRLNVARVPTGNDSLYAAAFQGAVCIDDTTANCPASPTSGTIYTEGAALSSFDLAEMYATTDSTLMAGDLVSFSENAIIGDLVFVDKSDAPYQQKLMGIVSTKPGITLGYPQISPEEALAGIQNKMPIALSGRVPTKVSTKNGPISIGDPLTSSSTPGVAMKATEPGMIVGFALEPFGEAEVSSIKYQVSSINETNESPFESVNDIPDTLHEIPDTANEVGLVLAFVNVMYYVPPVELASVEEAASDAGESLIDGLIQMVRDTWDLIVAKLTTNELTIKNPADGTPGLAGSGVLPANAASIVIANANVMASSKIFVTFKGALIGPWWISEQQAGGFTISVSGPQQTAVPFDYFILQVSGPDTPTAQAPKPNTQIPNNTETPNSNDQNGGDMPNTSEQPAPSSQLPAPDTPEPAAEPIVESAPEAVVELEAPALNNEEPLTENASE